MNMKDLKLNILKPVFSLLIILMIVVIVSACGGDDGPSEPTAQEIAQQLLESTWTLENGSIMLDGQNVSANYTGFTLVVADGSFTTTNAGDLFPAIGTWKWVGQTNNQAETGRGKQLTFSTLDATTFVFSFTKTSSNAVAGVSGNYVITLKK
tara:strand:- start:430 stop:885 length:456 start_codon:yes stop_codon:yes gene_type:complete